MSSTNLIRWGGIAAIIAGILRGVNSLLPTNLPTVTSEILYLITDIFILFGIMGIYGFEHQESGWWGFFGFLLAITSGRLRQRRDWDNYRAGWIDRWR